MDAGLSTPTGAGLAAAKAGGTFHLTGSKTYFQPARYLTVFMGRRNGLEKLQSSRIDNH